jgi:maltose O-acetyltransferase
MKTIFNLIHKCKKVFYLLKGFYISRLVSSCGSNFRIFGSFSLKNPHKLKLGDNVTINDGVYINAKGGIAIGDNVSISACSIIVSTELDYKQKIFNQRHIDKPIVIGNNVQIGAGAIVLAGVEIGNNVIVGAGSIVTKNIDDNSIVVGNPARMIKKIRIDVEK